MAMNALLNQGGNKQSSHSSGLGGLAQSFLGGSSSHSNQSPGSGNMLGSIASSLLSSGHEKPQQGSHASSSHSGLSSHSGGFGSMVNSFLGGGSVWDKYICNPRQN